MDIHSDFMEPTTPATTYDNVSFWRNEDSGYHTSFTPGSIECSESNENLDPSLVRRKIRITGQIQVDCYDITPEVNFRLGRKYKSTLSSTGNDSLLEPPVARRGVKRPYQEDTDVEVNFGTVPTPTSVIAGGIQRLKVNDNSILNTNYSTSSVNSEHVNSIASDLYYLDDYTQTSFPTTPVKKICRSSCKLSPFGYNSSHRSSPLRAINNVYCPPRRSVKKLNFTIHSLSCETKGLQPVIKNRPYSKVVRTIQFRPNQKIDIIKMLYEKVCCMPAIMKVFSYLSNEDIYNFSLVSPTWLQVCEDVSKAKLKKQEHVKYLQKTKENQENKNKDIIHNNNGCNPVIQLKEIHNIGYTVKNTNTSPPGTPRTIRFNKFIKSASLDSRVQLKCVRCRQPAKVTEEMSGEEWVECTSTTCSYQFCKFCMCDRHPGKTCFQYDLEGPSPSKRKKSSCVAGTQKSKRNLRRL